MGATDDKIAHTMKALQEGLIVSKRRPDPKELMGLVCQMRDILTGIDKSVGKWNGRLELGLMPAEPNPSQA